MAGEVGTEARVLGLGPAKSGRPALEKEGCVADEGCPGFLRILFQEVLWDLIKFG